MRDAGFVATLGAGVVEWLDPRSGERILDLGCGDGTLTAEIAARGCSVVGVDGSEDMVAAARGRGLDARVMDGQALVFEAEFDAVFSNAALHWMPDARKVAEGARAALRPGGRFVAEFGGFGNCAAIVTALTAVARQEGLPDELAKPWYFPTAAAHTGVLEAAGFHVERMVLFPRPTPLDAGMRAWLEVFRAPLFDVCGARRQAALDTAEALLAPALRDEAGNWTADYVRLRFDARAV
ncbi:class I SAM-dependent methyltransferase [Amorphus orientalis]|uniref:SAM-dependent methyltransferase n=1 Tax=Amorphus orientalis TaxID=649198 RepID=A0AAE4AS89_9HYPH|nr:class I SAM-dependent methyltransferase [Amorphus orientalis]MDQ0314775.1 SAM-dependent methyltransferase [Amorphus orientalis]